MRDDAATISNIPGDDPAGQALDARRPRGTGRAHSAVPRGNAVEVIVRKFRKKRTLSQNAWYWAVIVPMIADAAGYEDTEDGHEETDEALKWRFLRRNNPERPIFGNTPQLLPAAPVRSSTSLDTVEMAEYCEDCRRFAAQTWGLDIPDPKRAEPMGFRIE